MMISCSVHYRSLKRFLSRAFVCGVAVCLLGGCAGNLNRAADRYYAGQPDKALELLAQGGWQEKRDKLLYLVEQATILHDQREYQKSIALFLQADRLIKEFELISASEQTASLIGNEWLTRYKGEYSERLWIHTYLMMNYLLSGSYDDALVEAKRAQARFEAYPSALRRDYFTRALMALCFANVAEDNDALLIYRHLANDLADSRALAPDIVYHARRLGMVDLVEHFGDFSSPQRSDREGELVLFLSSGRIPEKVPGNVFLPPSIRFSFPYYNSSQHSSPPMAMLSDGIEISRIETSLGAVAEDSLDARRVSIMAKEAVRVAGKEALAQAVGDHNDATAEALVRILLLLTQEADVRCWKTLPAYFALIRVALPAGRHNLRLWSGDLHIDIPEFRLRAGQRWFHALRLDLFHR